LRGRSDKTVKAPYAETIRLLEPNLLASLGSCCEDLRTKIVISKDVGTFDRIFNDG